MLHHFHPPLYSTPHLRFYVHLETLRTGTGFVRACLATPSSPSSTWLQAPALWRQTDPAPSQDIQSHAWPFGTTSFSTSMVSCEPCRTRFAMDSLTGSARPPFTQFTLSSSLALLDRSFAQFSPLNPHNIHARRPHLHHRAMGTRCRRAISDCETRLMEAPTAYVSRCSLPFPLTPFPFLHALILS